MKKFLRILVLTIAVLMVSIPVFASDSLITSSYLGSLYDTSISKGVSNNVIRVQLNGQNVDFTDDNGNKVEPQIINNRTMVPMRKIFEVFGAEVEWIAETRSIKSNSDGVEINLQIDNNVATLKNANGEVTEIKLDTAPTIVNNRTLVPVRFIAESLDKKVGWDATNRMVIIIDSSIIEKTLAEKTPNFYDFLNLETGKMTSAEMTLELDGKMKMEGETLEIDGNVDIKMSEKAIALKMNADLDGSQGLMQVIKAQKLDEITLECVIDMENFALYAKSPLIENSNGKWVKYGSEISEEEKKEIKEMLNEYMAEEKLNVIDALEEVLVPSEGLTSTSYSELEAMLQIVTMVMSNDNFKVSGTTNKTYSFKFGFKELVEAFGMVGATDLEEQALFDVSFDVKMEDNIAKESKLYLLFGEKIDGVEESIELTSKATIKSYNKEVKITMPSGKIVLDSNEVQE